MLTLRRAALVRGGPWPPARLASGRVGPSLRPPVASLPAARAARSAPAESSAATPSTSAVGAAAAAAPPSLLQTLPGVYMELGKSRLSALVVLTTAAGHVLVAPSIDPQLLLATLGGTFLCSASANCFNQIIETDRDARMARTAKRPLPSGRISPLHAAAWACSAGASGVGILAFGANPETAALGAATIFLYTSVYTPMKVRSPWNTWVGAVVGAIPPVMGLTAAGGSIVSIESAMLGGSLFLWQIPHFLALAWMYRVDYAHGGYQMVPLTDPTGELTASLCLEYTAYLSALPLACWGLGMTTCMFPIESLAFNGLMLGAAMRFKQEHGNTAHAKRLFYVSLLYLPFFFFCLLLHQRNPELATRPQPAEQLDAWAARAAERAVSGRGAPPALAGELNDPLDPRPAIRQGGIKLCPHEHLERPSKGRVLCPAVAVGAAEEVVTEIVETAHAAVGEQQAQGAQR